MSKYKEVPCEFLDPKGYREAVAYNDGVDAADKAFGNFGKTLTKEMARHENSNKKSKTR